MLQWLFFDEMTSAETNMFEVWICTLPRKEIWKETKK